MAANVLEECIASFRAEVSHYIREEQPMRMGRKGRGM
jgi:hypothetical protein